MSLSPQDIAAYAVPSTYATLRWGEAPYPWQVNPLNALAIDGNRIVVSTCNASGKTSWLTSRGCLWYMEAFPRCVIVTTSASARQVQQQLYPNLRSCIGQFSNANEWKIRDNNQFYVKAPNGSAMFSFATNDAGRAEGYHVPDLPQGIHRGQDISDEWKEYLAEAGIEKLDDQGRLLVVIDEAKSVDEGIFHAFERCRASNWLVVSTPPLDPTGPFYECFGRNKEKYRCKKTGKLNIYGGFEEYGLIGYEQCPHLYEDKNELANIKIDIDSRGKNDAFVLSMHYGKFPKVGQNMVFSMDKVDEAMSGLVPHVGRDRSFCCDFSGGGDAQPFGVRQGNHAWIAASWHEGDAVVLADNIIQQLRKHRYNPDIDEFIGDNGGIGEACNDIIEAKGYFVRRFDFRGAAHDKKNYANVRAEGYFELAKRISLGEIHIEKSEALRQQLSWQKYESTDDRQKKIISKKKMPSSPDIADVMMMLFYDWQAPMMSSNPMNDALSACRGMMDSPESQWDDPSSSGGLLY